MQPRVIVIVVRKPGSPDEYAAVLTVEDVSYRYAGGTDALTAVTFAVGRGQVVGLVGPSGAGKSTLVRILIGLAPDYTGRIDILGCPLRAWGPQLYARIGVAFEGPTHYRKLTGRENLELFASLHPLPTRAPDELLALVGLGDAADVRVGSYSRGMAVRLGVARALLADPELLFLDEPTAGLDPANARRVADIISARRVAGTSTVVTTHDLWLAERVCDVLLVIGGGRVVASGSPGALRAERSAPTLIVRVGAGAQQETHTFPLRGAGSDPEFLAAIARDDVVDISTQRSELGDVLIRLVDEP